MKVNKGPLYFKCWWFFHPYRVERHQTNSLEIASHPIPDSTSERVYFWKTTWPNVAGVFVQVTKIILPKIRKTSRKQTNKTRSFVWSTLEQIHPSPNQEQLDPGSVSHVIFQRKKPVTPGPERVKALERKEFENLFHMGAYLSLQQAVDRCPLFDQSSFFDPNSSNKMSFGRFHANQMFTNSSLFPETLSKMCQKTRPRRDQCRCSHPWKLGTTPRHEIPWVPPCFVGKMVVPSL